MITRFATISIQIDDIDVEKLDHAKQTDILEFHFLKAYMWHNILQQYIYQTKLK